LEKAYLTSKHHPDAKTDFFFFMSTLTALPPPSGQTAQRNGNCQARDQGSQRAEEEEEEEIQKS
jgi:hypothetical protein